MRMIGRCSIVLAIVLLCQIASTQFESIALALKAFAAGSHIGELHSNHESEGKQLSMAGGTGAVLLEGKRSDPLSRIESVHQSLGTTRVHDCFGTIQDKRYCHQFDCLLPPVRKGYWLIYRALLL